MADCNTVSRPNACAACGAGIVDPAAVAVYQCGDLLPPNFSQADRTPDRYTFCDSQCGPFVIVDPYTDALDCPCGGPCP